MLLFQNAIRMHAVAAQNLHAKPKIGTISGYDPNRHAVKVLLQPEGNETGWIPLGALWVGNGWGMFAAPNLGTQVEVTFVDGNPEAGSANLRFFSNVEQALPVASGEFWLVHQSGAFFKLTSDGKATFSDGHGATVALNGDGTITSAAKSWTHTGDVNVTGTVTATTDVVGGGKSLKTHPHLPGSYTAGSTPVTGNSGGPT
jgi:phage baseplate assembly protein gpV